MENQLRAIFNELVENEISKLEKKGSGRKWRNIFSGKIR